MRYARLRRKDIGFPIDARTLGYCLGELADLDVAERLRGELGGKLALAAGPDPEDDVSAGDGEGNRAAEVGLDHRQRQVHPGSDACRGPHAAVLDMDGVVLDGNAGAELSERVELAPMRGCPPAVQRAGRGQEESAAAHRGDAGNASDRPGDDIRDRAARELRTHARVAACREQRVRTRQAPARDLRKRHVGDQTHARGCRERPGARRRDLDAISRARQLVVGGGEHLQRPGDVEQLGVWECEHQDVARSGHSPVPPSGVAWQEGQL